jgi:gluconokinase
MAGVKLKQAHDPLVLAIDIGSTASRARIFDATGTPVRGLRHRIPHQFTTGADGTAEIDPEATLREVEELIDALAGARSLRDRIRGVAMDTFAASLVGVDAAGRPLTPCYTYADSRPAAQVRALREAMDEAAVQQRTGCRFHTSYLPARLRWLRQTAPAIFDRVERWVSLGEYIYARLTGQYAASYGTAAWTGLLDRREAAWATDLIAACGARPEQFSPLHDTTEPLTDVAPKVARRWPALARAAWFPATADGYASNVGNGATDATTVAVAAATSGAARVLVTGTPQKLPAGLWCYRVDARRSLLGGALNDVGRMVVWLTATLRLPDRAGMAAALLKPPSAAAPTVLPFLTGERSTGWAAGARAVFTDVTGVTTPGDLFRGAVEGVVMAYARIAAQLAEVAPHAARILASGRVTDDLPAWLQVLADALGRPVTRVVAQQATLRGTALIALEVLAPEVPRVPPDLGETYAPVAEHAPYYRALAKRQQAIYAALIAG